MYISASKLSVSILDGVFSECSNDKINRGKRMDIVFLYVTKNTALHYKCHAYKSHLKYQGIFSWRNVKEQF